MIYKVYNGDKLISGRCRLFNMFFSKFRGLMFRKLSSGDSVLLKSKKEGVAMTAIHMFFVFFPIDVLFLDKNKKVLEIKENFKPFTFYYSKNKASYVIELPKNTVKNTKTKYNDIIIF